MSQSWLSNHYLPREEYLDYKKFLPPSLQSFSYMLLLRMKLPSRLRKYKQDGLPIEGYRDRSCRAGKPEVKVSLQTRQLYPQWPGLQFRGVGQSEVN